MQNTKQRLSLQFVGTAIGKVKVFSRTSPSSSATSNGRNMPVLPSY
jgi:hypothetical protein